MIQSSIHFMQRALVGLLSCALLLPASAHSAKKGWNTLKKDTVILGVMLKAGTRYEQQTWYLTAIVSQPFNHGNLRFPQGTKLSFNGKGQLNYAIPTVDMDILGIPHEKGKEVTFHKSGAVRSLHLRKTHDIQGFRCGAIKRSNNKNILLYPNGKLKGCIPPKEVNFQGLPLQGKAFVHFHQNGKLRSANLAKPHTIQGIPLTSQSYGPHHISLDKDGKLSRGILAKDTDIKGLPMKGKTMVVLRNNGHVAFGTLAKDTTIEGLHAKAGHFVSFSHKTGKLERLTLAKDTTISGHKLPALSTVNIADNKRLASVKLSKATTIFGFLVSARVHFHKNGKLMGCYLKAPQTIKGIRYSTRNLRMYMRVNILFHSNGQVSRGTLAANQTIQGKALKAGTIISFNAKGKLLSK